MKFLAVNEFESGRIKLDLNGQWQFSYDPNEVGVSEKWYAADHRLPERIAVPGCSQQRKFKSGNYEREQFDGLPEMFPGVLLKYPCSNSAWYKKTFKLREAWRQQDDIWLHVGGIMPAAEIWLNGHCLGSTVSSRSPFKVRLSKYIEHGAENVLAIRVFEPPVGLIGVFNSICSWTGIYRGIWLEGTRELHIQSFQLESSITPPVARVAVTCYTRRVKREHIGIQCKISGSAGEQVYTYSGTADVSQQNREFSFDVPMPGARLWHVDDPNLYRVELALTDRDGLLDKTSTRLGLREIKTDGFNILLNNAPIFLRGACDDHLYVETVCPPADKAFFLERIAKAKQYGFNYTKSCVDLFTEEFLQAADECGYLVCQEMPFFEVRNRGIRYNLPAAYTKCYKRELKHILIASRNHASVCVYSMSSELSTPWTKNKRCFELYSRYLPKMTREMAGNALVFDVTGASWGEDLGRNAVPVKLEHGERNTDLQGSWLKWAMDGCPLMGPISGIDANVTKPFILHEFAWITSLTETGLEKRLDKMPIKALHLAEMVALAESNGQGSILEDMVECSRKLKYALRKHAFELARQDPKIAGYHHWLIHDFPFCAEGVFNEFWEAPADLPADEFITYNGDTVLCLRDSDQRSFFQGEVGRFSMLVSHFGREPLAAPELEWSLHEGKRRVQSGSIEIGPIELGESAESEEVLIKFPERGRAKLYQLRVRLCDGKRLVARNQWSLWCLPRIRDAWSRSGFSTSMASIAEFSDKIALIPSSSLATSSDRVFVTDTLDLSTERFVDEGGSVLLFESEGNRTFPKAEGPLYRTVPYNLGKTGNMGTYIYQHPVLDSFPHDGWCDLCFAPLIQGAYPVSLDSLGPDQVTPIVRSIGHMRTMANKAYLFEIQRGKGTLMVCSMKIPDNLGRNPLSDYLFAAMLRYLDSVA